MELLISLGMFERSFTINMESPILQWQRLFTSGNHLRQLSIFLGCPSQFILMSFCWTNENKVEMFRHNVQGLVRWKTNTAKKRDSMPTLKQDYRGVMGWTCFAAMGMIKSLIWPWTFPYIKGFYSQMWSNQSASWKWVMQQDNDPQHIKKSSTNWLKKRKIKEFRSQPDWNAVLRP